MKKICILSVLLFILLTSVCFAADPKLITNLDKNLTTIKGWIIRIATPAAAVAIGARCHDEEI